MRGDDEHMTLPTWRVRQLQDVEQAARAVIVALDEHDAEWSHRHVSKRPNVPETLRAAIDDAREACER